MTAPQPHVRWTARHYVLRRQLERYKWSLSELRWLQTHARGLPPELEALMATKVAAAEAEEGGP